MMKMRSLKILRMATLDITSYERFLYVTSHETIELTIEMDTSNRWILTITK